jgi:hypothetical protein
MQGRVIAYNCERGSLKNDPSKVWFNFVEVSKEKI